MLDIRKLYNYFVGHKPLPEGILTPLEKIGIVEKQIDRLRKEVDDRVSSNNILWRVLLAGIGALILLKNTLDTGQMIFVLPVLGMILAAHWLNQIITLFRSGAAMAECEAKINELANEALLTYELGLTEARRRAYRSKRWMILAATFFISVAYWWLLWHLYSTVPAMKSLVPISITITVAMLANLIAAVNVVRFCAFPGITYLITNAEPDRRASKETA